MVDITCISMWVCVCLHVCVYVSISWAKMETQPTSNVLLHITTVAVLKCQEKDWHYGDHKVKNSFNNLINKQPICFTKVGLKVHVLTGAIQVEQINNESTNDNHDTADYDMTIIVKTSTSSRQIFYGDSITFGTR